jgi:2'-5' RNA ligase
VNARARCFVALDLPAPVRALLAAAGARLRGLGDVRQVPEAQLHLTLRFCGDIDERQRAALGGVVEAGPWPALQLLLSGLGQFPPRGAPRVLWAGVAGDVEALAQIASRIEAAAAAAGVPREDRPFHPHVTLGRARSPRGGARLSAALREQGRVFASEPFAPQGLTLYRSELGAGGSVHTPLVTGRLGA